MDTQPDTLEDPPRLSPSLAVFTLIAMLISGGCLYVGGVNTLECHRQATGAPPRCTHTRNLFVLQTSHTEFTLAGARLAHSVDDDGTTYRVHFINSEGRHIPMSIAWTNFGVGSMEDDVKAVRAFIQNPDARHIKRHNFETLFTGIGLVSLCAALIALWLFLSDVYALITHVRDRHLQRQLARQAEESAEAPPVPDHRPTQLPSSPAAAPNPPHSLWAPPLSDWPRPEDAGPLRRLAWALRLKLSGPSRAARLGQLQLEDGRLSLTHPDLTEVVIDLEEPFNLHLSVHLVDPHNLDLNVQLAPRATPGPAHRLDLRVRVPQHRVADSLQRLDTEAPFIATRDFDRLWRVLVYHANLQGLRPERQVS